MSIAKMQYARGHTNMFAFCREFLQDLKLNVLHFLLQALNNLSIILTFPRYAGNS